MPFRSKMGLDKEPGLIHLETSVSEGRKYWNLELCVPFFQWLGTREHCVGEKLGIMCTVLLKGNIQGQGNSRICGFTMTVGTKSGWIFQCFSTQRIYLSGMDAAYRISKMRILLWIYFISLFHNVMPHREWNSSSLYFIIDDYGLKLMKFPKFSASENCNISQGQ